MGRIARRNMAIQKHGATFDTVEELVAYERALGLVPAAPAARPIRTGGMKLQAPKPSAAELKQREIRRAGAGPRKPASAKQLYTLIGKSIGGLGSYCPAALMAVTGPEEGRHELALREMGLTPERASAVVDAMIDAGVATWYPPKELSQITAARALLENVGGVSCPVVRNARSNPWPFSSTKKKRKVEIVHGARGRYWAYVDDRLIGDFATEGEASTAAARLAKSNPRLEGRVQDAKYVGRPQETLQVFGLPGGNTKVVWNIRNRNGTLIPFDPSAVLVRNGGSFYFQGLLAPGARAFDDDPELYSVIIPSGSTHAQALDRILLALDQYPAPIPPAKLEGVFDPSRRGPGRVDVRWGVVDGTKITKSNPRLGPNDVWPPPGMYAIPGRRPKNELFYGPVQKRAGSSGFLPYAYEQFAKANPRVQRVPHGPSQFRLEYPFNGGLAVYNVRVSPTGHAMAQLDRKHSYAYGRQKPVSQVVVRSAEDALNQAVALSEEINTIYQNATKGGFHERFGRLSTGTHDAIDELRSRAELLEKLAYALQKRSENVPAWANNNPWPIEVADPIALNAGPFWPDMYPTGIRGYPGVYEIPPAEASKNPRRKRRR